tara:strand:- start:531 stop:770 length:240 start_codon:yes stop_codon:yes gene_type:complete
MQKIIITTDAEEDEILRVLQALRNGDVHLADGEGGTENVPCASFTCHVMADKQGYMLATPEDACFDSAHVGCVDIYGRY